MAETSAEHNVPGCIFCSITCEKDENKVLWQDQELSIIADHRPASDHHYLVLTNRHIPDVRSLVNGTKEEMSLISKMFEAAKSFLSDRVPELKESG